MESNLITALWKSNSRKVAFGAILFVTSTVMRFKNMIAVDDWMMCAVISSTLIGGGTLADRWMNGKKGGSVIVTSSSDATAPPDK